jgi:hypothetical protein
LSTLSLIAPKNCVISRAQKPLFKSRLDRGTKIGGGGFDAQVSQIFSLERGQSEGLILTLSSKALSGRGCRVAMKFLKNCIDEVGL